MSIHGVPCCMHAQLPGIHGHAGTVGSCWPYIVAAVHDKCEHKHVNDIIINDTMLSPVMACFVQLVQCGSSTICIWHN